MGISPSVLYQFRIVVHVVCRYVSVYIYIYILCNCAYIYMHMHIHIYIYMHRYVPVQLHDRECSCAATLLNTQTYSILGAPMNNLSSLT